MSSTASFFLLLWILNLGTAFGAGLYETAMLLPRWFPNLRTKERGINSALMRETDPGRRFWAMVTTVPLTLLTLANAYFAFHASRPTRSWWLAAVLLVSVERVLTFTFFIPVAIKLMRAETPATCTDLDLAASWANLNHVRSALTLFGWLGALHVHGMSSPYAAV
jgi:hypothetical protein